MLPDNSKSGLGVAIGMLIGVAKSAAKMQLDDSLVSSLKDAVQYGSKKLTEEDNKTITQIIYVINQISENIILKINEISEILIN